MRFLFVILLFIYIASVFGSETVKQIGGDANSADQPSIFESDPLDFNPAPALPHIDDPMYVNNIDYNADIKALYPNAVLVDDCQEMRWKQSLESKYSQGEASIQESPSFHLPGEESLILIKPAKHYGLSQLFSKKISNKNSDLVVQYEVRFNKHHACGGAYVKLISSDDFEEEEFSDETQWSIMFGPDRCAKTNKVHFIVRHFNPNTKKYVEKHLENTVKIVNDRLTHLYTLHLKKDNTFNILIDGQSAVNGSLLTSFKPPIVPPQKIDDPEDNPPKDWDERETIPDPDAKQPEDWPAQKIDDPEAKKPEDWNENIPVKVYDEKRKKMKANPACAKLSGCGPWKRPQIDNPAYRPWQPANITNPNYKGKYVRNQIDNPDYYEVKVAHEVAPLVALGIDVWTMQETIEFDNFFVGTNLEEAAEFARRTFEPKHQAEERRVLQINGHDQLTWIVQNWISNNVGKFILFMAIGVTVLFTSCCYFFAGDGSPPPPEIEQAQQTEMQLQEALEQLKQITEQFSKSEVDTTKKEAALAQLMKLKQQMQSLEAQAAEIEAQEQAQAQGTPEKKQEAVEVEQTKETKNSGMKLRNKTKKAE